MKKINMICGALTCFLLLGCAAAPIPTLKINQKVGGFPPIGDPVERSVGEVVYETFKYAEWRNAQLTEPVAIDVFAAHSNLDVGHHLIVTEGTGAGVFCTQEAALRVTTRGLLGKVCLRDVNNDQRFDQWRSPDGPQARTKWAPLDNPAAFELGEEMAATGGGYKYQLLYQGFASGVISLLYREYVDNLIRPAFQQDLSYTLEPEGPTQISFRTIRLEVDSADNNTIRYTVIRGLTTPWNSGS